MTTKYWTVVTLGGLFAGLVLAASPPEPILGGSAGQAMRIMVAGDGSVRCLAVAGFRNSEGASPEPDRTFDLSPGQTGFFDLNLGRLAGRFGQRVELRPLVRVLRGKCSAAVEVFEVFTGRSMAYMRLFAGLANPPESDSPAAVSHPAPIFPPLSVVQGQVVRLGSAKAFDPQPEPPVKCTAILAFVDARGNRVGPAKLVDLAPGRFDFVDVSANLLLPRGAPLGTRVMVQPRVLLPVGGGDLRGCDASVQVWEGFTGATVLVYVIPGPCYECL